MGVSPAEFSKYVDHIIKPRFRTDKCFVCGDEAIYYYGHGHATLPVYDALLDEVVESLQIVVLGRCKFHAHSTARVPDTFFSPLEGGDYPAKCEYSNDGCAGRLDTNHQRDVGYSFIELFY